MSLEGRLYVVVRESVGEQFSSYGELAAKVHKVQPAEFSYSRLDVVHVMRPTSIVAYVSLIHHIGLLKINNDEQLESTLDEEPTPEGAKVLLNRKSIAKLKACGLTSDKLKKIIPELLQSEDIILPTLRELYRYLGLDCTENQFLHLCSLGGVREYFGFTVVTRRIVLPTKGA